MTIVSFFKNKLLFIKSQLIIIVFLLAAFKALNLNSYFSVYGVSIK